MPGITSPDLPVKWPPFHHLDHQAYTCTLHESLIAGKMRVEHSMWKKELVSLIVCRSHCEKTPAKGMMSQFSFAIH